MTLGPGPTRAPIVEDVNNLTVRLITSTTHAFSGEKLDKNETQLAYLGGLFLASYDSVPARQVHTP